MINGVDVTQFVNERDRWYPSRAMLRPPDPEGMRAAWGAPHEARASTAERARAVREEQLHQLVGGEWSFVDTLRQILFAMHKWCLKPLLGAEAFHPWGLPNAGFCEPRLAGHRPGREPTLQEALDARAGRASKFRAFLDGLTTDDLVRTDELVENGSSPVSEGVYTVFEEQFHHNRYALRDLALLE